MKLIQEDYQEFITNRCLASAEYLLTVPDYADTVKQAEALFTKLHDILGGEGRELLNALDEANRAIHAYIEVHNYRSGYRDGVELKPNSLVC